MHDFLKYTAPLQEDPHYPGVFIAFEGGDGAGKSTQIKKLAHALSQDGYQVVLTREPGGTEIGEALRTLVLDHGQAEIDPRTEALIFAASRAAHTHQKIIPALAQGAIVLCDRYIDSSAAYQGAGRQLGIESIVDLSLWATENLTPDLTLVLDLPLGAGRARTGERGDADRMESEPDSFHTRVHSTFKDLAHKNPERYAVIDASASIDTVHSAVLGAVRPLVGAKL